MVGLYDVDRNQVRFPIPGTLGHYNIGLERFDSSAAILDMIAQVSRKTWGTRAIVGYLVGLLDALLGFQERYGTNGVEQMA